MIGLLDEAERVGHDAALPVVRGASLMRKGSLAILEDIAGRNFTTAQQRRQWADEAEQIMRAADDLWQLHEVVFLHCRTRLHDDGLDGLSPFVIEAVEVAARCENRPIFAEALLIAAEFAARCDEHDVADEIVDLADSLTTSIWNRRWLTAHQPNHVERLERAMAAHRGEPACEIDMAEERTLWLLTTITSETSHIEH